MRRPLTKQTEGFSAEEYERLYADLKRRTGVGVEIWGETEAIIHSALRIASRCTEEDIAEALCRADGTAQCAALCLQHSSLTTQNARCPEKKIVWGHKARAILRALKGEG